MKQAKQILKDNKNIMLGKRYTVVIYSVIQQIDKIQSEIEFRHLIRTRAEEYFANYPNGLLPADNVTIDCYKLLRYFLSTQRLHLMNLRQSNIPSGLGSAA